MEGKIIIDRLRAVSLFSAFNRKSLTQTNKGLGTRPTKRIGNAAQLKRKTVLPGKKESNRVGLEIDLTSKLGSSKTYFFYRSDSGTYSRPRIGKTEPE